MDELASLDGHWKYWMYAEAGKPKIKLFTEILSAFLYELSSCKCCILDSRGKCGKPG